MLLCMMRKVLNISDTESLSDYEDELESMENVKGLGFEMKPDIARSRHMGPDVASSSGTNLRSSFIGMGFSPSLIDKVFEEKGEEDADLLLDTLFAYTAHQKLNSELPDSFSPLVDDTDNNRNNLGRLPECHLEQRTPRVAKSTSSDSLDCLLDDEKYAEQNTTPLIFHPKQEVDLTDDIDDDKRASLLMMKFSMKEVDFAISKLGQIVPIIELVDFIIAAQIAESENGDNLLNDHIENDEDTNAEALFGTMDKTLQLLKMGFNEHDVSLAIEKLGSKVPIAELANCICASQMGESYPIDTKPSVSSKPKHSDLDGSWYRSRGMSSLSDDAFKLKTEEPSMNHSLRATSMTCSSTVPKEEFDESNSFLFSNTEDIRGKRPKEDLEDDFSACDGPTWKKKTKVGGHSSSSRKTPGDKLGMPKLPNPTSGGSLDKMALGAPYFLYGNIVNLSSDGWRKVSQFLYALEPEFVNTQFFSAFNRKEGYIHNLPTEDRSHVLPKSPMTIEEAMPHSKKWWPSWDSRKQLSCICCETSVSQFCRNVERMLADTRGVLSNEQQKKILYHCRNMNLVWVGPQKLAPMEPEYLERILGYPMNHTRNPGMTLLDRLESLRNCFQTDTLGYLLSVLKPLFPGGITLLSVYSGIGGAEVALHRLGIFLKGVVSVESSDMKRRILRRWWQNTDQAGELVQIEDIQKLNSSKLEYLMKKFGGFDLVICQNPCTYAPISSIEPMLPSGRDVGGLDFTLYYEFVRVLQRVKNMTGRMSSS